MKSIFAQYTVSITELKKNPSKLIEQAESEAIAILNHNIPTAYLLTAKHYESLLELLDDQHLAALIKRRESEKSKTIKTDLGDL